MADRIDYLLSLLGILAGGAITAYVYERAKNRATLADIRRLTEEVESVKSRFSKELEDLKATHNLRGACLEERLAAHQEAYTLWLRLVGAVHDTSQIGNVVGECQQWWDTHCLYLDEEPRQSFVDAFRAAHIHSDLLKSRMADSRAAEQVGKNWERIMRLGPSIERAMGLPPVNGIVQATAEKPAASAKE